MKTCTIRRQAGKWFACFCCEVEAEPLAPSELSAGIDAGLLHFAALSDGSFIDNPRFLRKQEKALAKAQRKQSTTKRGTPERKRANKVIGRVHEHIRNHRDNFLHQQSHRIVEKYGLIKVERLNIDNMLSRPAPKQDEESGQYVANGASRKSGLNKSIADAAWGQFRFMLSYKAERAGREYAEVDPAYTSQECLCGHRASKTLDERVHDCPACGLHMHRDTLSAKIVQLRPSLPSVSKRQKGMGRHTLAATAA